MSLSLVGELIKKKYKPEQYAAEQAAKEESLKEMLAFVDGVLTAYNQAKAKEEEIKKSGILFVSDPSSPCGFKPGGK